MQLTKMVDEVWTNAGWLVFGIGMQAALHRKFHVVIVQQCDVVGICSILYKVSQFLFVCFIRLLPVQLMQKYVVNDLL